MKQRESIVLRGTMLALASRGIQILEPQKWSKYYPPPFFADDQAIRGVAWRQNTGMAKFERRAVVFGIRGQADIAGMLRGGRAFGIECKDGDGALSPNQLWYHKFFGGLGMLIAVVRGYEDTLQVLDKWGIK